MRDGDCTHAVLVVEDDEGIRESIVELLRDEGYSVVGAANGREALDALRGGGRPCLVLLDLMMPIMSGWQFLDEIAHTPLADLPVILVTAARDPNVKLPGRPVLAKPVRIDVLLEAVKQHCAPAA
jgi:CheY-like chemotaxis protein